MFYNKIVLEFGLSLGISSLRQRQTQKDTDSDDDGESQDKSSSSTQLISSGENVFAAIKEHFDVKINKEEHFTFKYGNDINIVVKGVARALGQTLGTHFMLKYLSLIYIALYLIDIYDDAFVQLLQIALD